MEIGRIKKSLAVMLAMLMVLTILPVETLKAEALTGDKTTLDLSNGSIVIGDGTVSQSGQSLAYNANGFIIMQSASGATKNTISVTGGTQNIALSGVNINVSAIENACAFSVAPLTMTDGVYIPAASVNLTLNGENSLKSAENCAALQVPLDASVSIKGTDKDKLTATGGAYAAGIGGGKNASGGSIVINGGTINASGGSYGAAIGGGCRGNGGIIVINDGVVNANGGLAGSGIGGGYYSSSENVTINGGTVKAVNGDGAAGIGSGMGASGSNTVISGGSVYASSVESTVTDGYGNAEYCVTVDGLTNTASVNASVNGGKTFSSMTDSNGKLYLWMPDGDNKATICCNNTYYGANVTVSEADTTATVGAMTVLDESKKNISITDSSVSGADINNNAVSVQNPFGYVITSTGTANVSSASISSGTHNIVLDNLTVDDTVSGLCPVSVKGNATVYLTLSGENKLTSAYGSLEVTENASAFITGTDNDKLESTCIGSYGAGGAGIGGGCDTFDNVHCGTVKISGGNITANGASRCAGIGGGYGGTPSTFGNSGKITIAGGTVNANGGNGAAGIGGALFGSSGQISVAGGKIEVSAMDGGAAIGGGYCGSGGAISISGGTVAATTASGTVYEHCGAGIGDGCFSSSVGTVKITGGSVNTPSISCTPTNNGTTPVYPTVLTLPSGTDVSELSITQTKSYFYGFADMQTDSNEKLYLYLPASAKDNDTIVNVTASTTAYNGYHGTVKTSGTQSDANVLKMDQSSFKFLNTVTQIITYGDNISPDIATFGNAVKGIVSYTYSGEDKLGNTYNKNAACPTNAGNYTVTAALAGDDCYYDAAIIKNITISPKDISTQGVSVDAASEVTYSGSALSPSVTAAFGSNTLVHGADFDVYDEVSNTKNPTYTDAGSYQISVRGTGNYTGNVTKTFLIAKKEIDLALTASPSEAKAGGNVNLTAAVSSGAVDLPIGSVTFKYGDTTIASGVNFIENDGKYTAQTIWENVPAGEYNITAEYVPATNDNYFCSDAATINGYSITKTDQTGFGFIDETISKTFGDDDFTVSVVGGQGSGNVTYQSSDTSIATVTDNGVVSIKKTGAVTITAKKDSDYTYNEAVDTVAINIGKAASSIKTAPVASDIEVVGKLSSSTLTGGEGSVAGSFDWIDPNTVVKENGEHEITFIPNDSTDYLPCTCKVKVTVTPVITNSVTGVQYDLTNTDLPDGVTSVSVHSTTVSEVGPGSLSYSVVKKLIDGSTSFATTSEVKLYNLSLEDQNNQNVTGFTGKITVKIPIPSGMSGDLHVYFYNNDNGTVTDMNAKQENGYLMFETTHFSYYAIAELTAKSTPDSGKSEASNSPFSNSSAKTANNPNTGDNLFPLLQLALFSIPGCGFVVVTKRRRFRKKSE